MASTFNIYLRIFDTVYLRKSIDPEETKTSGENIIPLNFYFRFRSYVLIVVY